MSRQRCTSAHTHTTGGKIRSITIAQGTVFSFTNEKGEPDREWYNWFRNHVQIGASHSREVHLEPRRSGAPRGAFGVVGNSVSLRREPQVSPGPWPKGWVKYVRYLASVKRPEEDVGSNPGFRRLEPGYSCTRHCRVAYRVAGRE